MRFKVLKSSFDGICGSAGSFESIDEALREICYSKGWPNIEELHGSIRHWAKTATPGSLFPTQVSAVIAIGQGSGIRVEDECTECLTAGLDYGEFEGNEDGGVTQEVSCSACGARWNDVFVLAERRALVKKS